MSYLSDGDQDLHYGNGAHRRRPPASLQPEETAAWRAKAYAHRRTHRVNGDAAEPESEWITLEVRVPPAADMSIVTAPREIQR